MIQCCSIRKPSSRQRLVMLHYDAINSRYTVLLHYEAHFRTGIQYCSTMKPSSGQTYSTAQVGCPLQSRIQHCSTRKPSLGRDTVLLYKETQFMAWIQYCSIRKPGSGQRYSNAPLGSPVQRKRYGISPLGGPVLGRDTVLLN